MDEGLGKLNDSVGQQLIVKLKEWEVDWWGFSRNIVAEVQHLRTKVYSQLEASTSALVNIGAAII